MILIYRYGFNGKEHDGDMDGNDYDYWFRIYNPQIGRFLSVDPLTAKYPMLTPYQFASNRPIDGIDLDGLEYVEYGTSMYRMGTALDNGNAYSVVNTVYENIPSAIQDPKTKSFKSVYDGPVGTDGQDEQPPSNGWILSDRYFTKVDIDDFSGKDGSGDGKETKSTEVMGDSKAGVGAGALVELGGLASNQVNASKVRGLNKEKELRNGFYQATKVVDGINQHNGFGGTPLSTEGRANLINFMSDGSLPINGINQKGFTNDQKLQALGKSLDIANAGIEALSQLASGGKVELQKPTVDNVNNLLKQYTDLGGDTSKYDTMKPSLKPSTNE